MTSREEIVSLIAEYLEINAIVKKVNAKLKGLLDSRDSIDKKLRAIGVNPDQLLVVLEQEDKLGTTPPSQCSFCGGDPSGKNPVGATRKAIAHWLSFKHVGFEFQNKDTYHLSLKCSAVSYHLGLLEAEGMIKKLGVGRWKLLKVPSGEAK
jgi:DNA-binding transcriptional ArsR family regulator